LEIYQCLLEWGHYMLTCHVCVQFLLVLLNLFLVKWLECYYWTTHNISLLLVIIDMITNLVEPDSS
jgi:uncharacterized membrane protein